MRRTRILIDTELQEGLVFPLPERTARHLTKALRLRTGETFIVFDGHSHHEALAVLTVSSKKSATAEILSIRKVERESPLELTLVQSISSSEKMDFTLQKAVELGVKQIAPVWSERSQRRLKPAQLEKKMRHWQGVIAHATEQSGRTILTTLQQPISLRDYITGRAQQTAAIVLDPGAGTPLGEIPRPDAGLEIHIGPEGGFSEDELHMLVDASVQPVSIGPRILRTETAGMAVIAWLQVQFGIS